MMKTLNRTQASNLYVKNLDKSIDNKALYDIFSPFGNILSCKVAQDETGQSKGYGFVHFETEQSANKSIEKVNDMLLNGKKVYVGPFIPRKEMHETSSNPYKGMNLYVKNLDDTFDDERLRKEFMPFGNITSAKVMKDDRTNSSKHFGFVCFSSPDEAAKAVSEMHGRTVGTKPLYVAFAQRKEERKALLSSLHKQRMANNVRMQQNSLPGIQHVGQIYQPNGASGYFLPTIPQSQHRFFSPPQMTQIQHQPIATPVMHPAPSPGALNLRTVNQQPAQSAPIRQMLHNNYY